VCVCVCTYILLLNAHKDAQWTTRTIILINNKKII
jgi:hypothetical protein